MPHQACWIPEIIWKRGLIHERALLLERHSLIDRKLGIPGTLSDHLVACAGQDAPTISADAGIVEEVVPLAALVENTLVLARLLPVSGAVEEGCVLATRTLTRQAHETPWHVSF